MNYDGISSNYDIEDTAAALISAGDSVLNVNGVANVTVDAPGTGTNVNAADGAALSAFTADVGFDVVDNAAGLIAQMDGVDPAGHLTEAATITVNDGTGSSVVNASDGAMLASFTADIDFDVSDTAANLAAQVASGVAQGSGPDSLDEADSVFVESGAAVTAAQAESVQDILNYSGGDIDITDNAANLISAGDHVLNVTGVDVVTVDDAVLVQR